MTVFLLLLIAMGTIISGALFLWTFNRHPRAVFIGGAIAAIGFGYLRNAGEFPGAVGVMITASSALLWGVLFGGVADVVQHVKDHS